MTERKTPAGHGHAEVEIKQSRFIADVWPVEKEEEVWQHLERIRSEHRKASHHVFAFRLTEDDNLQRFSDDGEPGGTAGRPVMEVIRQEEVHQVLVVVTRYFGGTLLGSGGLIRAYSQAAREGIKTAGILVHRLMVPCQISVPYEFSGKAEYFLSGEPCFISNTQYTEEVTYLAHVPVENLEATQMALREMTSGQAQFFTKSPVFLPVKC